MEETLPSILASVYGWFTPAVLFLLVNLVIGSIAIASKSSSSAVSSHRPGRFLRRDSFGDGEVAGEILGGAPPLPAEAAEDEPRQRRKSQHFGRSQSDARPTAEEMPRKLAVRLKTSTFGQHEEAEAEEAGAAAAMDRTAEAVDPVAEEVGKEVDARADDFINRFRHQLMLQQLESIIRYKESLNRPS